MSGFGLVKAAAVAAMLSAGLMAAPAAPAGAQATIVPQAGTDICPTILANATLYQRNSSGTFIAVGTVHAGDVWATYGNPDIDNFTSGVDRTSGGRGWVLESTPMGAPFVSCTLP